MIKACFCIVDSGGICTIYFFQARFSNKFYSNRRLRELRSAERPVVGNYKRPRIPSDISHTSNIVHDSANIGITRGLEILEAGNIGGFTIVDSTVCNHWTRNYVI